MQVNGLYKLPQEILEMITGYLIDCDRLSLEASCRRPTMRDATITSGAKSLFKEPRYEDYVERTTVLEARLWTEILRKLIYSACCIHHPRFFFTAP
jgi:hypothetical protein